MNVIVMNDCASIVMNRRTCVC